MCGRALAAGLLVAILILLASSSAANADVEIGSPGTGAGETQDPRGLDVDEAQGLLYVADRGNSRIDVFDASSGAFIKAFGWGVLDGSAELQVCTEGTGCLPGIAGGGPGQLDDVEGIAVDNDPSSPGFHSIYVFESGNLRVQKFSPAGDFIWMAGGDVNVTTGGDLCASASGDTCGPGTAGNLPGQFTAVDGDTIDVGPGGTIYVGDRVIEATRKTRVQMYSPEGSYLGYLGGKLLEVAGEAGGTVALGVDSDGYVYVGTAGAAGAVRKYDSGGNELLVVNPSLNVNTIALGLDDHLFVGENAFVGGEIVSTIYEYDPSGTLLRAIYGSLHERTYGLAIYSNPNGDIFAVELGFQGNKRILDIAFPPPGPVVYPNPASLFVGPLGNNKATLHGKVNPEGEVTTYHFEYIADADFQAAGGTFGAGTIKTPESGPLPANFQLHAVQAEIKGLATETLYHFRIVVSSAATGPQGNPGPDTTFVTKPAVEFGDAWSTDVGTGSAQLHVEVNPLGIPATGRFEYVELTEFETTGWANALQAPASDEDPIDLGESEEMLDFATAVSGLSPGAAYHFRFVLTNECGPPSNPICEFSEPERTFVTFLPVGAGAGCSNDAVRAAGSGTFLPDCRGYEMVSPVDKNGADLDVVGNINGFPAGLDQAALDGGSITYSSYKAFGDVESAPYTNQYLARRDATAGWTSEAISPKREGPALMMYLSAALDRQYKGFTKDLCNGWVVQDAKPILAPGGIEGYPGLYRRDSCAPGVGAYEALTTVEPPATAPPNLPPRKFIPEFQGMSADGSVSIFDVNDNLTGEAPSQPQTCVDETSPSGEACEGRLYEYRNGQLNYVCILPDGTTWSGGCGAGTTNAPTTGAAERGGNLFNAISADGSHIFWSTSTNGPGKLYVRINGSQPSAETVEISSTPARFWKAASDGSRVVYSVADQLYVFDVATEAATPIAAGVGGVAGASEDVSRIYFASTEVLTGTQENPYGDEAVGGRENIYLYEGATPGITFIGSLAPADEADQTSPVSVFPSRRLSRVTPDGEQLVFMSRESFTGYDNVDANSKQRDLEVYLYDATSDDLLCPSCNPSGARPEGRQLTQKLLENRWAAARIPTFQSQLYGSRVISDDGSRLYFNSFEALVSTDTNGKEDAYQWEAAGKGSCTEDAATYHSVSGGCVDLISSGKSSVGSEVVDISSNGDDVFFKTTESLVTQDPGLRDIYDARVKGGFLPLPPQPIICQGENCPEPAKPAPVEAPPVSRAPAAGNPTLPKPKPKRCRKGTHKVKGKRGKVRCVKNKRKHKKQSHTNRRAGR